MWKTNLGINVTLENQEWAVFQETRKAHDFEMARGGWLTDFMDPIGLLGIFTTGNVYNSPQYTSAEFDQLLEESTALQGQAHFDKLYEAQEVFMNDMPMVPVYHYTDKMMASDSLVGWDRSVLGTVDFSTADLVD